MIPSNLEIVYAALENRLILVAGDVFVQVLAAALRMAHLAEDTAIRAGDALDGEDGTVGVVLHVHAGAAVLINVLGRDLAVGDEGVQHALRCHEAALTVADGHGVLVAHAALGQPGAAGGGDAGAHQHTLVAADGVEGQGRVAGRDGADVAVSGQTQLDEGLEAVADAQHQTITVLQQVADFVFPL